MTGKERELLEALHEKFIKKGYSRFCIEGVGDSYCDDEQVLYYSNGFWEVAHTERGHFYTPTFSSRSLENAIAFYENLMMRIKHNHIAVFTRDDSIKKTYSSLFTNNDIEFWENNIPHYSATNDIVYRLFVFGTDIFKIQELDSLLPYMDPGFK